LVLGLKYDCDGRTGEAARMKILIVDDHVLIRDALRGVLKGLKSEAVILEAPSSRQAMQSIEENPGIELILLDLNLPDRDGFDVLVELRERYPAVSVVVLSGTDERDRMARALDLGALGFIPKSAQREVMIGAFNLIFAGGIYVPPEILARPLPRPGTPAESGKPVMAADLGLTDRQMDVLSLMMQGKSNKAICRVLDLAEPTVKNHVTAILKALKASNRTEAVIAAGMLGVAPPRDPQ
jgi:DNA-binding NarL/FixJ family response regulator